VHPFVPLDAEELETEVLQKQEEEEEELGILQYLDQLEQVTARLWTRLVLCISPFIPVHWIASSVVPYSRPRRLCAGSQLLPGEIKLKMRSDYYAEAFILGLIKKRRTKVKTVPNRTSPQQLLKQVILSLSASSSRLTNVWGGGGQGWVLPPPGKLWCEI
jgi:hypothetical protein